MAFAMASSVGLGMTTWVNPAGQSIIYPSVNSDPTLIQIDATNFINNGLFSVDLTGSQLFGLSQPYLFQTSDTLNFTNTGTMIGVVGFDLEQYPNTPPPPQPGSVYNNMAANFVNRANGLTGGAIICSNMWFGFNPFDLFGTTIDVYGLAMFKASATNIIHSGSITTDKTGYIGLSGETVDLTRGLLTMTDPVSLFTTTTFGVSSLDYGIGTDTNLDWNPGIDLGANYAVSSLFNTVNGLGTQLMILTNSTPYFDIQSSGGTNFIVRAIFIQNNVSSVSNRVFIDPAFGAGFGNVEWSGTFFDPSTGLTTTNYFYLADCFICGNNAFPVNGVPDNFSFTESVGAPLLTGAPTTPGFVNIFPDAIVTNNYSYVDALVSPTLVSTNADLPSVTNLPGRIEIRANRSLQLARTQISGPNYLLLQSTNQFEGNQGALIGSPYSDIYLGVTNGYLTVSNLMRPALPLWNGSIQAWNATWLYTDTNAGVTYDFRVLLINSDIAPGTPTVQQDLVLHAANSLVLSDTYNVYRTLYSDAVSLTLTTNGAGALSTCGGINLLSQNIVWSTAFPNLKYLTNSGIMSSKNLQNFAGNMPSFYSDPGAATPYEVFINNGSITNQGTFVYAKYFENGGSIVENTAGSIVVQANCATITNSFLSATNGDISVSAQSLFVSNSIVAAGRALTLAIPSCLTDGYPLGNQFGQIVTSNTPANIVTNGNTWSVGGTLSVLAASTEDLLGTTITNTADFNHSYYIVWPGSDRGVNPSGFANNLALGRLILDGTNASQFTIAGANGNNALYVDSIEFLDSMTNTTTSGDITNITIAPGMKVYYAQAMMNGVSVAEKLNGKNGGGFLWVSNYAGVYSSTNLTYSDGNTYVFNAALAGSCSIGSGGPDGSNTGTANCSNPEPIPTNWVFVTSISELPCDCDPGFTPISGPGGGNPQPTNAVVSDGTGRALLYPGQTANMSTNSSNGISFSAAQGSYNGLFYETNGVTPSRSGYFSAKTTATGNFSARLQLGAAVYAFSGQFDPSGYWSGTATGKGLAPLNLTLQLGDDQILGTVAANGWTAELWSDRAAFSSQKPTNLTGKYTLVLSGTTNGTPAGDGFGLVTVDKAGNVQWSGTLADGSKVSQKSALSAEGVWPLYSPLYGGAGSLISWMQITNQSTNGVPAFWILPSGTRSLISGGLTNQVDALGSAVTGTLQLPNGTIVLSGGGLTMPLTNHFRVLAGKVISTDSGLTLSISTASGLFKGSTVNPDTSQKISFQGALLEKSGEGQGFFINSGQSGKVYLGP